ncbi:hypothetical protein ACERIT_15265 (plasmid) [Halopenitus sp. H-Gu1]|uniref:hypothetical protein n=1 Tax=Halopenitus sp. H-Gu1 TaxID=3242697 RepID=UPI00359EB3E8
MADDEMEDAGVSWTLLDDRVTMDIIPREDSDLRVRFQDDEGEVLWSSFFERGFWESRTKKGEIGNKLADNTSFAKSTVKEELESVWTDLSENAKEYESNLVSPSVEELIENTQAVEVHGGEETERHVYVKAKPFGEYVDDAKTDGGASVRKLVFSNEEWVKSDGDTQTPPVVSKYSNAFYETLEITWQEWREDIRPRWKDKQQIVSDDQMSTADRIAMSVVRSLRHRLDAHADRSKILNDSWNGWYEADSPHGEVVWIPGDTLDEAMDNHDKGTEYRSALSRALKAEGYTLGSRRQTTIQGDPVELYPFIPETVGIEDTDVDVIGLGDEDDDDDDGDESDADDAAAQGDDDLLDDVVGVVDDLDPNGKGVPETEVVAEASTKRDLGPPDDITDAIERGILSGVLYRPEDEEQELVAVRPGGGETPGEGDIDPDEDGVPEP